jgi:hypothetical protein
LEVTSPAAVPLSVKPTQAAPPGELRVRPRTVGDFCYDLIARHPLAFLLTLLAIDSTLFADLANVKIEQVDISDTPLLKNAAYEHIQHAKGQAFNIGGGLQNSMSLLELLLYLEKRLGIKLNYTHLPWRQSDQKFFVADNSKAHRLIQWEPVTTKEQGIESVLNWEAEAAKL